jgi:integrase
LLVTGLRRGEALALKVSDMHLDDGLIVVRCGKFGKSRFVADRRSHRRVLVLPNPLVCVKRVETGAPGRRWV